MKKLIKQLLLSLVVVSSAFGAYTSFAGTSEPTNTKIKPAKKLARALIHKATKK